MYSGNIPSEQINNMKPILSDMSDVSDVVYGGEFTPFQVDEVEKYFNILESMDWKYTKSCQIKNKIYRVQYVEITFSPITGDIVLHTQRGDSYCVNFWEFCMSEKFGFFHALAISKGMSHSDAKAFVMTCKLSMITKQPLNMHDFVSTVLNKTF